MFNYKYIVNKNKVICLSSYAGKAVRGIAKCAPNDTFDEEFGKDLATARCAAKIAAKRYNRATKKFAEANKELTAARAFYDQMAEYFIHSKAEYEEAKNALEHFEKEC